MTTKNDDEVTNRSVLISGDTVRADGDELSFPLSSEQPYRRYDGLEILDHSKESVDLSFLNGGSAPLMDNHDRWSGLDARLGVITKAWLEKKRLYVTVKFSSRQKAQEVKQDIEDGILRNVSVGYEVKKVLRSEDDDEYRVTLWKPKEASIVLIPADETVGVGRSTQPKEGTMPDEKKKSQASSGDDVRAGLPGLDNQPEMTEEQRGEALEAATNEISSLAAEHNMSDVARSFINGALSRGEVPSVPAFKGIVRAELPADKPLRNEDVGLTREETQQFSLCRYLNATLVDNPTRDAREAAAFELEVSNALGAGERGGLLLPAEIMRSWNDYRDADGYLSVNTRAAMSAGGNPNVQSTDHLAGRFFDALRDRLVLGSLGVTMFTGLDGDIEFPGQDTVIAGAWLAAEDADAAESVPTYRKVSMSVKDVATYTDLTRRMLMQSTIDVEMDVRRQIVDAIAASIDIAGFYGSGASGQPTGIANTAGIGSVDFGVVPTLVPSRDDLIDMRSAIAGTNKTGSPVFVGNTTMAAGLMKTLLDAGSGRFLMDASNGRLEIGNRYEETNMITDGDLFAGVFDDLIMGTWGTLELDRSTEAKFLSGGLRLRAIQSVDFGVRRVGSFVLGNDGAT